MRGNKALATMVLLAVIVTKSAVTEAQTNFPDLTLSTASLAYQGTDLPLTLMIVPSGTGSYFNDARTPSGDVADATVILHVVDMFGSPIPHLPREDMWLQTEDGAIAFCGIFEWWPDFETDPAGMTTWLQRPKGGGYSENGLQVHILGSPLESPHLELKFNSPDINGDLRVNLSDVVYLSMAYYGEFNFRSDLHRDGVINLSDIVPMAMQMGRTCNN